MRKLAALLLLLAAAGCAGKPDKPPMFNVMNDYAFDIPATSLADAAQRFAEVTDTKIVFNSQDAIGVRTNEVRGTMTPDVALKKMLFGTDLSYEIGNLGNVAIQSRNSAFRRAGMLSNPPR